MLTIDNLHDYQKTAAKFIVKNEGAMLLLSMGLGKTISTLTAINHLQKKKGYGTALILAPLRVAYTSWPDEIANWKHTKDMTHSIIHGKNKGTAFAADVDLHISNYESLKFLLKCLKGKKKLPWDILVLDESSRVKSAGSQRFKMLKKLRGGFKKVICLTGTPCPQALWDIWSQVYMLDGGKRFGASFPKFKNTYFYPTDYMKFNWIEKPRSKKLIQDSIRDITLSMKAEDYLELPEVVYNDVQTILPAEVRKLYDRLSDDFFLKFDKSVVTAESAAVLANKLRQVLQGGVYDEDRKVNTIHSTKVDALAEIVEDNESPILCAYQFRFEIDMVKEACKGAVFFTGHAMKDRNIIERWNAGEIKLLCVHPASAGHGLNLQHGGHTIVWLGLTWSLEHYLQLNARLDRQGQKEKVIIHHIVCKDTVDSRVAEALRRKDATQSTLIDNLRS